MHGSTGIVDGHELGYDFTKGARRMALESLIKPDHPIHRWVKFS
jgi:hypothetical protein